MFMSFLWFYTFKDYFFLKMEGIESQFIVKKWREKEMLTTSWVEEIKETL